ncbi:MAG: Hsp20/alpha crystallin family protein [Planctomycetota bacterium]|nr:Hsp20/alpha crystallin family protein [Planctomycetota bacterium]MCX8040197.1 Hsp20/alpha crystallin family protein [Planctomycetota bacterium]MDW8372508.1 Hsp20/alpha crystallin family protein [Planctomycetota bacterium]
MTSYAWDPFREIDALMAGLDRLLDRTWSTAGSSPGINVYANDEAAVVTTELPGVRPDQVQVQLLDDVLTITAERAAEATAGELLVNERPELRFSRSVALPFAVDANQVEARLKDGILTVALRRTEADRPRKITVATA